MNAKKTTAKGKRGAKRTMKDLPAKTASAVKGGKASPVLMQACATGTHMKEATIT
jgi:type VI protein secretion system component Hcp